MKNKYTFPSNPFTSAFRFKGGMGTPPPAIPPVSRTSTDVSDAERQQRMSQMNKQGMKATLIAGAQGSAPPSTLGTKSLLG